MLPTHHLALHSLRRRRARGEGDGVAGVKRPGNAVELDVEGLDLVDLVEDEAVETLDLVLLVADAGECPLPDERVAGAGRGENGLEARGGCVADQAVDVRRLGRGGGAAQLLGGERWSTVSKSSLIPFVDRLTERRCGFLSAELKSRRTGLPSSERIESEISSKLLAMSACRVALAACGEGRCWKACSKGWRTASTLAWLMQPKPKGKV